jgi:S1-C subfamily serine protease
MNDSINEYQDDGRADITTVEEDNTVAENGASAVRVDEPNASGRTYWRLTGGPAVVAALTLVVALSAATAGTVVHHLDGSGATKGTTTTAATAAAAATGATKVSAVTPVLAKIEPSVVDIDTTISQTSGSGQVVTSEGAGTGIVISATGEIVTNAHVIADATSIKVTLADGTTHTATVVKSNSTQDLAVIQISGVSGLTAATFADSTSVSVGDTVIAVGNALGYDGAPTVTEGIISATNRSLSGTQSSQGSLGSESSLTGLLQTDAALNPGNSGGPLVNTAGAVVGIDDAIATGTAAEPAQNVGFAIPSTMVTAFLATVGAAS